MSYSRDHELGRAQEARERNVLLETSSALLSARRWLLEAQRLAAGLPGDNTAARTRLSRMAAACEDTRHELKNTHRKESSA